MRTRKDALPRSSHPYYRPYLTVLAIMLLVTACAKPYDPPRLDEPGHSSASAFPGIMSYADNTERHDTRVVWFHGMCHHSVSWAENRHGIVSDAAGLSRTEYVVRTDRTGASRITFKHQVSDNELEFRYLLWSPISEKAKFLVKIDDANEGADAPTRASLNRKLKRGLINDCLSDAVIYLGSAGYEVRRWAKEEVCNALSGVIDAQGKCRIDPTKPRPKVVFVAESLGSKILSDALLSIWKFPSDALAQRLSDVQMVFFAANQIPLLNASTYSANIGAKLDAPPSATLLDVFADARFRQKREFNAPSDRLRVVAFTDPNDLLSYRLLRGAHLPPDIIVTNVLVSNDSTYLGLLERPDTAHCGYGWNPYVTAAIVNGYDGLRLNRLKVKVVEECGLGD